MNEYPPYHPLSDIFYTLDSLVGEIWVPIIGWEGYYEISNMGRVKSIARETHQCPRPTESRIIKIAVSNKGYCRAPLNKDAKSVPKSVHRLVAIAFISNPENKSTVNHKRGNKFDNRASELEWATSKEQIIHSIDVLGKDGRRKKIHQLNKNTLEIINTYAHSGMAAKALLGRSSESCSQILRAARKGINIYGYKWQFAA